MIGRIVYVMGGYKIKKKKKKEEKTRKRKEMRMGEPQAWHIRLSSEEIRNYILNAMNIARQQLREREREREGERERERERVSQYALEYCRAMFLTDVQWIWSAY